MRDTPKPLLMIQGEHDARGEVGAVHAIAAVAGAQARVEVIAGANHVLAGHLETLMSAVTTFVAPHVTARP